MNTPFIVKARWVLSITCLLALSTILIHYGFTLAWGLGEATADKSATFDRLIQNNPEHLKAYFFSVAQGHGIGLLMTATTLVVLTIVSFIRAQKWIAWYILALGLGTFVPHLINTINYQAVTNMPAPISENIIAIVLIVAAFILMPTHKRSTD